MAKRAQKLRHHVVYIKDGEQFIPLEDTKYINISSLEERGLSCVAIIKLENSSSSQYSYMYLSDIPTKEVLKVLVLEKIFSNALVEELNFNHGWRIREDSRFSKETLKKINKIIAEEGLPEGFSPSLYRESLLKLSSDVISNVLKKLTEYINK